MTTILITIDSGVLIDITKTKNLKVSKEWETLKSENNDDDIDYLIFDIEDIEEIK